MTKLCNMKHSNVAFNLTFSIEIVAFLFAFGAIHGYQKHEFCTNEDYIYQILCWFINIEYLNWIIEESMKSYPTVKCCLLDKTTSEYFSSDKSTKNFISISPQADGVLATGLCTLDPPLGPPSTWAVHVSGGWVKMQKREERERHNA